MHRLAGSASRGTGSVSPVNSDGTPKVGTYSRQQRAGLLRAWGSDPHRSPEVACRWLIKRLIKSGQLLANHLVEPLCWLPSPGMHYDAQPIRCLGTWARLFHTAGFHGIALAGNCGSGHPFDDPVNLASHSTALHQSGSQLDTLPAVLSRCSYIRARSWSYASPMTPRLVLGVDYTSNIARGASSMLRVLHLAV